MTTELAEPIYMWRPLRWILFALASTVIANIAAWVPSFWGAEKLLPVQLVLPWACIVSARWLTPVFLSPASLIEWPFYVLLLFIGSSLGHHRKTLFVLIVLHLIGCAWSFACPVIPIGFPDI